MYATGNLSTLRHSTISEANVKELIEELKSHPIVSPECREAPIPFICQYVYPPCLNDTSYDLITTEQCNDVKDVMCDTEWSITQSIFPGLLPDCEIFNDSDTLIEGISSRQQNRSNEISCTDQFDTYCNKELCVPSCKHFSHYDDVTTSYRNVVDIIAAIITLISGTLFIIIAVRRRKNL